MVPYCSTSRYYLLWYNSDSGCCCNMYFLTICLWAGMVEIMWTLSSRKFLFLKENISILRELLLNIILWDHINDKPEIFHNGIASNRRQVFLLIDAEPVQRRIYASLWTDTLTQLCRMWFDPIRLYLTVLLNLHIQYTSHESLYGGKYNIIARCEINYSACNFVCKYTVSWCCFCTIHLL